MPSIVVVLRANATCVADISGVITPKRSSGPMSRSSMSVSGLRMLCEPDTSTWLVVEEQHEQPRARRLHQRARLRHGIRIGGARVLRALRADHDVLELHRRLRLALFADLEIALFQIENRTAVRVRGVDVHAHVVGFSVKGGLLREERGDRTNAKCKMPNDTRPAFDVRHFALHRSLDCWPRRTCPCRRGSASLHRTEREQFGNFFADRRDEGVALFQVQPGGGNRLADAHADRSPAG